MHSFFTMVLIGFSLSTFSAELQVLHVDEPHIQMGKSEAQPGKFYDVEPAGAVLLDATGYDFSSFSSSLITGEPNELKLVIENTEFSISWKPEVTKYFLDTSTLSSNAVQFPGFHEGERFVIAIGKSASDGFRVYWLGVGNVTSKVEP